MKGRKRLVRQIQAWVLVLVMVFSVFQGIPGLEWADRAPKAQAATLRWPVPGHTRLSQGYHNGNAIDINDSGIFGATVVAAMGGTVTHLWRCGLNHNNSNCCHGFGTGIVIQGNDGRIYQYAHMKANSIPGNIVKGSQIQIGQKIGEVGSTGNSTGAHLHFGISLERYWYASGINPQNESYVYEDVPNYTVNTGSASDISNNNAVISGSMSPSGNVSSWGFYVGTNQNSMQKCTVSTGTTSSGNMRANVSPYYRLSYGTTYYYKIWAVVNGQEKSGGVNHFTTTANKPNIPTLKVNSANQDIGIGTSPNVYWSGVSNATYYKLYLYNSDKELLQISSNVTGTKFAFNALDKEGVYTAYLEAYNEVGTKGKSNAVTFTVHPDVTVKFVDADSFVDVGDDYEPEVLREQKVHYGQAAVAPSNPEHKGYTFKKWSASYNNVKEDTVIKAVYEINQYTVKFVDSTTSEVLGTEKVDYYSPVSPVAFTVPTGYVPTGYNGWDKDYSCITEDTTFYTCIGWYNENFPIYAEIVSAVREYDAEVSDNEGYTIVTKLTNWDESTTKGRVVVALKTEEGKLLTSTESSAFSIKKSSTKELEIFVPYDKAASIAEIYVVGQYKDAVPITTTASNNATMEIDQSSTYTNWSTEEPPEDIENKESRTEWRYRDKTTATSYSTTLSGFVQSGSQWVQSGSGSIDYVSSFPSGFHTGSGYYSTYNRSPRTAYENTTNKTIVSTSIAGYLYYHWCRGTYTSGPINRTVSDCWTSEFNTFHAFTSGALGYNSSAGAFQCNNGNVCRDTYWWLSDRCWSGNQVPIYRCNYTDYRKLFSYYKWSDYSDWSTTQYTAGTNRQVESRTVYRYQNDDMMVEDNSGEERTIKGSLGAEFAGKEAALFIYKVDEASDYTNEYVDQMTLDENGNYEFTFKLREEPSVKTGDFTVTLGVEGTSTAIFLEKIEAPKPEYTVKFYDYNGEVISTQTVKEGENAELPSEEELVRTGYTFQKWSDTNIHITEDKDIYAEYEINTYDVVFVDWEANSVEVKEFEYGAQLVTPIAQEPEEGMTVTWDALAQGITTVTDDMVVCTQYAKKEFDVKVEGYDGTVLQQDKVNFGEAVNLPELEDEDGKYVFLGWKNIADGQEEIISDTLITKNTILCPAFVYTETAEVPVADVESGVYDEVQTVTLSSGTENADIYYTLDGSDPKGYNGILYTEPIEVDSAVNLQFYACKAGMNDSAVQSVFYAVNRDNARSAYMIYDELPEEVKEDAQAYDMQSETGYTYKDTRQTTLTAEASAWEDTGWKLESDDEYTEYSDWQDDPVADDGTYIGVDIDTQPVYGTSAKYKYSHYVYSDGTATCYAKEEVEGFECTIEETEEFTEKLNVAAFDEEGEPYYVYDGQIWYNQEKVTGTVQTGTQYRYRQKIATYYKWSDYSLEEPAEDEEREYEEATVFSYIRHNYYLINIHTYLGMPETYLAEEGSSIDLSKYEDMEGYTFGGVYTDEDYTTEWNEDVVGSSLDLYVNLTPKEYTVTFVDSEGENLSTETVAYLEAAEAPEAPEVEGYKFVGWDSKDYECVEYDMTVTAKYVPEDEYATVSLDNESINLYVGKSMGLTAIVKPAEKSDAELSWTSSDEIVAVVSSDGEVTAVSKGTATITVTVLETGETAECTINVKTDTDTTLSLLNNSDLSIDKNGFLRGVKAGSNTVSEICSEFSNTDIVCKNADGEELAESDVLGTGSVICLVSGTKILDEIEVVVVGDISGDGVISNRDVSMMARALLDKEVPSDSQILAGDVNGDGEVGNRDVSMISRAMLGKGTI